MTNPRDAAPSRSFRRRLGVVVLLTAGVAAAFLPILDRSREAFSPLVGDRPEPAQVAVPIVEADEPAQTIAPPQAAERSWAPVPAISPGAPTTSTVQVAAVPAVGPPPDPRPAPTTQATGVPIMVPPVSATAANQMEPPAQSWTASITAADPAQVTPEEQGDVRQVIAVVLNVRSGPSSGFAEVAELPLGTKVRVLQTQDRWLRIEAPDGSTGWVHRRYLRRVR